LTGLPALIDLQIQYAGPVKQSGLPAKGSDLNREMPPTATAPARECALKTYLETERLILREFTEADADHLLALDSDPDVMRYIGPYALPNREAYCERIRTVYQPYYARTPGFGCWAVLEKASGDFLGWFFLRPARDHRFADEVEFRAEDTELGYRFRKAAWGKGFATEGARALVHKAFAELGVCCMVATAIAGNLASIRVMEKAGLKRVGAYSLPGWDEPAVKYALDRAGALITPLAPSQLA
jgi:RimJ/RimL family protein N-acetyltransferase